MGVGCVFGNIYEKRSLHHRDPVSPPTDSSANTPLENCLHLGNESRVSPSVTDGDDVMMNSQ